MNARLQQLADQATDDILGMPVLDPERFAELIVRECANIANINSHQWQVPGEFVLRHFEISHE